MDDGTINGFSEAFDVLFPRARRLAQRIVGDLAAAEDIAAEALARTYLRWSKVGELPYRDAWVLRVAANLAIDAHRRPKLQTETVAAFDRQEDEAVLRVALVAALRALSRRQREALTLHYLAGLSQQEVARCLGVSATSVATYVQRGTSALRLRLGDDFKGVLNDAS